MVRSELETMKTGTPLHSLLTWRAEQAEADAPPAPRAARLLHLARPWWERSPEQFAALVAAFDGIHARIGYAMDTAADRGNGFPVPAVIARPNVETNLFADILYLHIRGRTLRLRFQLPPMPESPEPMLDVTFVAVDSPQPILSGTASLAPSGEYRLELELSVEFAQAWAHLRVTDRMPFRFVLRPADEV